MRREREGGREGGRERERERETYFFHCFEKLIGGWLITVANRSSCNNTKGGRHILYINVDTSSTVTCTVHTQTVQYTGGRTISS